jgi:hypothetical protein
MKPRPNKVVAGVLALLVLAAAAAFAEYDKDTVVKVMRSNFASLPKLNAAANSGNYMEAAGYLLTIAQGMYSVKDYTSPKGEKADWDATFKGFLKAAFNGLAACGNENQDALKAAVAELVKFRDTGHKEFR